VAEQHFAGSYHSVRRFALRLAKTLELPFRRIEVESGQEPQVDFWARYVGDLKRQTAASALVPRGGQSFTQRL